MSVNGEMMSALTMNNSWRPPQKLLDLYKYESTRAPGHFSDAVYNANAHVLLHDDSCFRFESRGDDGTLTIQMLDPDRTEVAPGEENTVIQGIWLGCE